MKPIISPNIRVRVPDHFEIGEDSIVDDFCYFSTRVRVGQCSHIANGCSVAGGAERLFSFGDFSSLSAGVRIWCASNDYVNDLIAIYPSGVGDIGDRPISGDVVFGDFSGVGANSVVMPDNRIPEGAVIGALSYVPANFPFEPWTVYAGIPIRPVRARNRERVLGQVERLREALRALRAERGG